MSTPVEQPKRQRIVVGVDGSSQSIAALQWAASVAPAFDAEIVAMMVWHFPTFYGFAPLPDWDPEGDAGVVLQLALDKAFGADSPSHLLTCVTEGQAAQALVTASETADLLIVGSRGRGGFKGLLLGSVSAHCVEHAKCPVVVIHDKSSEAADSPETVAAVA